MRSEGTRANVFQLITPVWHRGPSTMFHRHPPQAHPAANRAGRGSVLVPVNIIETQTVKKPENGIFAYTVPKKRHPSKTENQGHNPNASFSLRPFCKNETERTCFGKVHFAKAACVFSKRHPNASTCIRFRLDRSWKVEPERMALNPNGSFSRRAF